MPLTRISMGRGKPLEYRRAIMRQLYLAMTETFDVPEGDWFMALSEHDEDCFDFGPDYLDIARSGDLILVQITVTASRSAAQKKALYARIVERLATDPGLRPEDVFINLLSVSREDWSLGHGQTQYA